MKDEAKGNIFLTVFWALFTLIHVYWIFDNDIDILNPEANISLRFRMTMKGTIYFAYRA